MAVEAFGAGEATAKGPSRERVEGSSCHQLSLAIQAVEAISRADEESVRCEATNRAEVRDEARRQLTLIHHALKAAFTRDKLGLAGIPEEDSEPSSEGTSDENIDEDQASYMRGRQIQCDLLARDLPRRLIVQLNAFDFEGKKKAVRLIKDLLRNAPAAGLTDDVVAYFTEREDILETLLEGASSVKIFGHCNEVLRDLAQYSELVRNLFSVGAWQRLLALANSENFEFSSESFATLREFLFTHKAVTVSCIAPIAVEFFDDFHSRLLAPETDYVVKRQATKVLADLLLDRSFGEVMVMYVSDDRFLQIHMKGLRDSSRTLQLGSFHIFKIFVANPRMPRRVNSILCKNKAGLLKLLNSFSAEAAKDDHFSQDLSAVSQLLSNMEPMTARRPSIPAQSAESLESPVESPTASPLPGALC